MALKEFDGQGYGTLKKAVAEVTVNAVEQIQLRYDEDRGDCERARGNGGKLMMFCALLRF
jgi:hypothetical protein